MRVLFGCLLLSLFFSAILADSATSCSYSPTCSGYCCESGISEWCTESEVNSQYGATCCRSGSSRWTCQSTQYCGSSAYDVSFLNLSSLSNISKVHVLCRYCCHCSCRLGHCCYCACHYLSDWNHCYNHCLRLLLPVPETSPFRPSHHF